MSEFYLKYNKRHKNVNKFIVCINKVCVMSNNENKITLELKLNCKI